MKRTPIFEPGAPTRRIVLRNVVTLYAAAVAAPVFSFDKTAFAAPYSGHQADEATLPLTEYPRLFNSREKVMGSAQMFGPRVRILDFLPMNEVKLASLASPNREAVDDWLGTLDSMRSLDRNSQIRAVNAYINKFPYRPDASKKGLADEWLTPPELFRLGGDCEDYVVAKYLSLSHLGFHDDRLRMVTLRLPRTRRARPQQRIHAVLAVYLGGTAFILDNLYNYVYAHDEAISYRPIFSLNRNTLWRHET